VSGNDGPRIVLRLPPLDGPTAAWILDLCGQLQSVLLQTYGDEIEAHWTATEADQPIYGRLQQTPPKKR
jgi:hypothetical protein